MGSALQRLMVVSERYPELKASASFRDLQAQLTDTENQIQYARRFYNGAVRILNTRIQSFPYLLLADPSWAQTMANNLARPSSC